MTTCLYFVNVTLHVLAARVWLGGMIFLAVAAAPMLRMVEHAELRRRLFEAIGVRFRLVGWWAIALLVVTGIVNLHYRGWLKSDVFASGDFWRSAHGHALAIKLAAVLTMIGLRALHDFVFGPAASRAAIGTPQAAQQRRRAVVIARANALIGIIAVIAAVRLAR